jgi:hypothetical protein
VLARFAYLAVTHAFAALWLVPLTDREKDVAWSAYDRTIAFHTYGHPLARAIPDAEVLTPLGVGHVPMHENPQLIVDTILDITQRVDNQPNSPRPTPHPHSATRSAAGSVEPENIRLRRWTRPPDRQTAARPRLHEKPSHRVAAGPGSAEEG